MNLILLTMIITQCIFKTDDRGIPRKAGLPERPASVASSGDNYRRLHMPESRTVKLTRGKSAIVDASDYDWINQWKWCADKSKNIWYSHRTIYNKEIIGKGRFVKVRMHRLIIGAAKGEIVDHINGNGIDNRRENLQICSHSDNIQKGHHRPNQYGYLGVSYSEDCTIRHWKARISNNGKRYELGHFLTSKDAAKAYDEEATRIHGATAKLNFPKESA